MLFEPHKYQEYCIKRLIADPYIALMLDMGLGKTVITLSAIEELKYNRWAVQRPLIVAPKKVAEATWQTEAARWDHLRHLSFSLIAGRLNRRVRALAATADVYIISRDNIAWLVDYYKAGWPFDMVVLDESSSYKDHRSKRFQALRTVRPHIRRLVELTGTPAPNGLSDLWAQIYLLDQGTRLGRTLSAYRSAYFTEDRAYPGQMYRTYTPQSGAQQRVQAAISDICISMQASDYLSLPDLITHNIPVALDAAAQKAYDKLETTYLLQVDQTEITAGSAAVLNGKLLQLCSGAAYDADGQIVLIHDCKLAALGETVEQLNGAHAIIFYWFKHEPDRIKATLRDTGLRVQTYSGAADAEAWNAGEIDLLLAHPASCGYGLNLQMGGNHIIWYTLPNWNLELYQQANKRLHRQGQERPVYVHRLLVCGGLDEDMAAGLESKGDVQDALLQALKARISKVQNRK